MLIHSNSLIYIETEYQPVISTDLFPAEFKILKNNKTAQVSYFLLQLN